jgi:putative transposase
MASDAQLAFACDLYNAALEQRRDYRRTGVATTFVSQCRELTDIRTAGDGPYKMSCSAMRDPLRRVERAFQGFFRRVKSGEKAGYPRFRSRRRYDSLTWDYGWSIREQRLVLQGIGHVKVKWHRTLPALSSVRTVTVRRVLKHWYATFTVALPPRASLSTRHMPAVGLDLGIRHFAALSTGELIPGPRAARGTSRKCRIAQRRVSRRHKGSRRRGKAAFLLARLHLHARSIRRDHAHRLSRRLVANYSLIAVEDLQVSGLARGPLSKDVNDQGWAGFLRMIGYKAEDAGVQVVRVPPWGTSQVCSKCRTTVPKQLSERMHDCPVCGLHLDRDVNAARNILRLGLSRQALTWPTGAFVA